VSAFLPFARPDIDEQTIAAVGEVLRSGWITSGPQVQRFEEALSAYCDGRRCAPLPPRPRRSKSRSKSPASARATR
jgi:dTDP-4-amino-4,6-dideoxygalactose transaminase